MKRHGLIVWGDFACFSRPDIGKVERFSYPVMTPSAARGVLDAIYCKPTEFRWQIKRIEVLKPLSFIALKRNETKEKVSVRAVQKWMRSDEAPVPIFADVDKAYWGSDTRGRTQRQTMALKDVAYRIVAEIRPWPGFEKRVAAFSAQFTRRASFGKCFQQPYFGCREFPAYFRLDEGDDNVDPPTESVDMDLGFMLYDVFDLSKPGKDDDPPCISLFRAVVRKGVLEVPEYDSKDVRRAS